MYPIYNPYRRSDCGGCERGSLQTGWMGKAKKGEHCIEASPSNSNNNKTYMNKNSWDTLRPPALPDIRRLRHTEPESSKSEHHYLCLFANIKILYNFYGEIEKLTALYKIFSFFTLSLPFLQPFAGPPAWHCSVYSTDDNNNNNLIPCSIQPRMLMMMPLLLYIYYSFMVLKCEYLARNNAMEMAVEWMNAGKRSMRGASRQAAATTSSSPSPLTRYKLFGISSRYSFLFSLYFQGFHFNVATDCRWFCYTVGVASRLLLLFLLLKLLQFCLCVGVGHNSAQYNLVRHKVWQNINKKEFINGNFSTFHFWSDEERNEILCFEHITFSILGKSGKMEE